MSELYLVANVSHISAKKNFNLKNHMTVRKRISSSSKPDQPRFYSFICLEVTVLQRYTTVWWLLDLRQSDLFTLVSNSFVRRNFKINKQPKGIKWSSVPLPCSTFSLVFMGGGRAAAPIA